MDGMDLLTTAFILLAGILMTVSQLCFLDNEPMRYCFLVLGIVFLIMGMMGFD